MVSAKPLWSALRNLLVMFIFENEYPKGQHICAHSVTHYALGISNFRFCFVLYFSLPNNLFSTLSSTAWVVFFFFILKYLLSLSVPLFIEPQGMLLLLKLLIHEELYLLTIEAARWTWEVQESNCFLPTWMAW